MREIKFRVWDIVWKKMLTHEDLWDAPFNELFISTPDQRPYNIMQYTGFKDKNDREIYEGDIVKVTNGAEELGGVDTGIGKVEWLTKWGFWNVSKIENGLGDLLFNGYVEVIGNIYEDPQLLEGAE
ncbi:YopX family protein [Bacillus sp. C28GYM-DRY-1]|uniref:YopX family protein n=1 Tax=Bacillus sp. C28GYM-DRY-1 TaxID=3062686 RepID=UPI0026773B8E|nr:YopX family protein [Bacillus sp. C28GYM-DRY-1]MDO3660745.1 YopX family protein [Bacillus sp. C28GYM-DRY-1]